MTRQYVFSSKQNDTPCTKYKITKEEWVQFKESRLTPEWQVDQQSQGTFVAQGREDLLVAATGRLDRPGRVRDVGGAFGLRDYFGPKPRSTKAVTQEMQQQQQQKQQQEQQQQPQQEDDPTDDPITPRVYRSEKQPIAQPVNEAREEAEDHDAISILTSRLNMLRKGSVEMLYELRTFGLECHVPLYINFDDAYEIIGGEKMINISCIQLWCMYMDTIVVESGRASVYGFLEPQTIQPSGNTLDFRKSYIQTWMIKSRREIYIAPYIDVTRGQQLEIIYPKCNKQNDSWSCGYYIMSWMKAIIRAEIKGEWTKWFNTTSPLSNSVITTIREEWAGYLNKHFK
ncbi:hypothetical protein LR48_Vigan07g165800 [Vigna angularis]|uniref:Ubiquitin-like protease family profile domain-containing protein n=1 Tax=Phaseolus angularis TaxID=3914 RepID=A0A0L9UZL0_PHAAN|nr:hypothetical protein LR48_Vigan07g165800 [Vigna angularis]